MGSVNVSISMPDDVYFDMKAQAEERGASISRMVTYFAIQGFGLMRRGFHVVGAPHDNRFLSPPPKSWLLPMDVTSPRDEIERRVAIEMAKRTAK